jgi:hypothetical protein
VGTKLKRLLTLFLFCILTLIPVKAQCAYIRSTAIGGNWSNPASWSPAIVPGLSCSTDTLQVIVGSTITFDGGQYTLGLSTVSNVAIDIQGTLDVPYNCPTSTLIVTGHIQVIDLVIPAQWTIGSSANPYLSTNTFNIYLSSKGASSPSIWLHSPVGSSKIGVIRWYGSYLGDSSSTTTIKSFLAEDITTSRNSCILQDDMDLVVGQRVIIGASHLPTTPEICTVIAYDHSTPSATFNSNFSFGHTTGTPVGMVSRNIIVCSTYTNTSVQILKQSGNQSTTGEWSFDKVEVFGLGGNNGTAVSLCDNRITISNSSFHSCGKVAFLIVNGSINNCIFGNNTTTTDYPITISEGSVDSIISNSYMFGIGDAYGCYSNGTGITWDNDYFSGGITGFYLNGMNTIIKNSSMSCVSATEISIDEDSSGEIQNYRYIQLSTNTGTENVPELVWAVGNLYADYSVSLSSHYQGVCSTPVASAGFYYVNTQTQKDCVLKYDGFQNNSARKQFYTPFGIVFQDTETVRTSAYNSIKVTYPYAVYYWDMFPTIIPFNIPVSSGQTVLAYTYAQYNSTYGATNLPAIQAYFSYAPNTVVVSTMTNGANVWQQLTIAARATQDGSLTINLVADNPQARINSICWFTESRVSVGNSWFNLGNSWLNGYPAVSTAESTIDASNLAPMINTSSNTLAVLISTNTVDLTPVTTAINTSSNTLNTTINASSVALGTQISTSTVNLLTNINTSSNTIFTAINISSNTLNNQINISSATIMAGISAIDLSAITGSINTSSNTLAVLISTNSLTINGNINTSSNTITNYINTNNDILVDKNWDENIISSHSTFNSSGRILREIRRKEP